MTEKNESITFSSDTGLVVPDFPTIPFIEGDGIGPDIWRATQRVLDAAVLKTYSGDNPCRRRHTKYQCELATRAGSLRMCKARKIHFRHTQSHASPRRRQHGGIQGKYRGCLHGARVGIGLAHGEKAYRMGKKRGGARHSG